MNLSATKADLRAQALARRASLSAEAVAAFAPFLAETGLAFAKSHFAESPLPASHEVDLVGAYWAIGAEAATMPLLCALDDAGFSVALPVTGPRGTPLTFRRWRPGDILVKGRMGIAEPPVTAAVVEPGLLFVPLAAADREGNRIGYGAGYYDLTLASFRESQRVIAVGVCFSCQILDRVPAEAHDQKLDYLLTEEGVTPCGSLSASG